MKIRRSFTRDDLNDIVDLLNLDGDSIRTDYRGRGMGPDATCVGFVVDRREGVSIVAIGAALVATLARQVADEDVDDALDDAVELAKRACVDSMGLDAIVYFPGVTLAPTN